MQRKNKSKNFKIHLIVNFTFYQFLFTGFLNVILCYGLSKALITPVSAEEIKMIINDMPVITKTDINYHIGPEEEWFEIKPGCYINPYAYMREDLDTFIQENPEQTTMKGRFARIIAEDRSRTHTIPTPPPPPPVPLHAVSSLPENSLTPNITASSNAFTFSPEQTILAYYGDLSNKNQQIAFIMDQQQKIRLNLPANPTFDDFKRVSMSILIEHNNLWISPTGVDAKNLHNKCNTLIEVVFSLMKRSMPFSYNELQKQINIHTCTALNVINIRENSDIPADRINEFYEKVYQTFNNK